MIEFKFVTDVVVYVRKDDELLCDLFKYNDIWMLDEAYDNTLNLTATELRQIADKLDELNNEYMDQPDNQ